VPHQILVGVAEDIVAFGSILGKVERFVLENGDEVGNPLLPFLAIPEL
jgi:hypothetical protein